MKPFTRIAVVVLWPIALLQLLRFILRREITLNGVPVPLWLSGFVAAVRASADLAPDRSGAGGFLERE